MEPQFIHHQVRPYRLQHHPEAQDLPQEVVVQGKVQNPMQTLIPKSTSVTDL